MATKTKKQHADHERAYIKTILRVEREETGFHPARIHDCRKNYRRSRDKRGWMNAGEY